MAFLNFIPLGTNIPYVLNTTNDIDNQIWQELTALRYLRNIKLIGRKAIAPWIDQAKTYYCDAKKSNWRSSGLLYYYCFLNLAKALLVGKKHFSYKLLNTTSLYHGLASDLQTIKDIIDFEIEIHPIQQRNKKNVFSNFYKILTLENWPFNDKIKIKLKEILSYCKNIDSELNDIFNINSSIIALQSLIRDNELDSLWFEVLAPQDKINVLKDTIPNFFINFIENNNFDRMDKNDWLLAHRKMNFQGFVLMRSNKFKYNLLNKNSIFNQLIYESNNVFKNYSIPADFNLSNFQHWLFIPKIN